MISFLRRLFGKRASVAAARRGVAGGVPTQAEMEAAFWKAAREPIRKNVEEFERQVVMGELPRPDDDRTAA